MPASIDAQVCNGPDHRYDPAYDCADVLVLVTVAEIDASYTRHLLDRVMKG